jgi:hypothetical protein
LEEYREMADGLGFDVCPETGIGCVMVNREEGMVKIDLMPDETQNLQALVKSGDLKGAKALLAGVDARAEEAVDDAVLEALAREIG